MELEEYQPLRSALKKLGDAALKAVEGERGQTGQLSESDAIQGGEMDATRAATRSNSDEVTKVWP